jgi:hypothetical protein
MVRNSCRFRSIVESIVGCYFWATVIVSQMVGVGSFQERRTISPLTCHLNKLLQFSQPKLITVCVSSARFIFTMLYPSQNCEECCSFLRLAILLACAIYWRSQPALWLFELAWANLFVLHGHAVYFPTVQVLMKSCASLNGRESNGGYFCSQVAHFVWNIDQVLLTINSRFEISFKLLLFWQCFCLKFNFNCNAIVHHWTSGCSMLRPYIIGFPLMFVLEYALLLPDSCPHQ